MDPLRTSDVLQDPARILDWDGLVNARDLGGLPAGAGAAIRPGALVRSAGPDHLTEAGWRSVAEHGIRTVIDLRNDDEVEQPLAARPAGTSLVRVPVDQFLAPGWYNTVSDLDGTPRIFRAYLRDGAKAMAEFVAAVAGAAPGGILVHCELGRDRTGLAVMVLLRLAGVEPEAIAADYELSYQNSGPHGTSLHQDDLDEIRESLTEAGLTAREAMLAVLADFDPEAYFAAAGVGAEVVNAARARLV
ncbi:MAG TPA: tyrosine-protein phosphatase [Actinocrinis sp.]|nr:tyrosine-protein phosphatase [Actinocrinis sp.]